MIRTLRYSTATLVLALGCLAAMGTNACTDAACGDLGTCAAPTTDAGTTKDASKDVSTLTNGYGVPYPTENLGWTPRTTTVNGEKAGDTVPNVVFEHLVKSRKPNEPRTVGPGQLADLYDPEVQQHDVIILLLATEWDAQSAAILEALGAAPPKTVVLTVFGESSLPGQPPSLDEDFPRWTNKFPWAWHALDPNFTTLAAADAPTTRLRTIDIPIVALIDARTMELAYFRMGATTDTPSIDAEIARIRRRYQ